MKNFNKMHNYIMKYVEKMYKDDIVTDEHYFILNLTVGVITCAIKDFNCKNKYLKESAENYFNENNKFLNDCKLLRICPETVLFIAHNQDKYSTEFEK